MLARLNYALLSRVALRRRWREPLQSLRRMTVSAPMQSHVIKWCGVRVGFPLDGFEQCCRIFDPHHEDVVIRASLDRPALLPSAARPLPT
jgi:hypothetical protein